VRRNFSERRSRCWAASREDKDWTDRPPRLTTARAPGPPLRVEPPETDLRDVRALPRIVDAVEQLLATRLHYHSKMILKDARTGGAWAWHQDYGYWYQNGVLFPDLVSVMTAVDPPPGRTAASRCCAAPPARAVNHILAGEQAGADMDA